MYSASCNHADNQMPSRTESLYLSRHASRRRSLHDSRGACSTTHGNPKFVSQLPPTEDWKKGALGVINVVLQEPLKLSVLNAVGGGDQAWAVVELEAAGGVCKDGTVVDDRWCIEGTESLNVPGAGMPYEQRYAWAMRFDEQGTIVQASLCQARRCMVSVLTSLQRPEPTLTALQFRRQSAVTRRLTHSALCCSAEGT